MAIAVALPVPSGQGVPVAAGPNVDVGTLVAVATIVSPAFGEGVGVNVPLRASDLTSAGWTSVASGLVNAPKAKAGP